MELQERIRLVKEVGEEIITEEDLKKLLQEKQHPIAYDGFEPSGRIHLAQGLMRAININKMTKAGCKFVVLVADWHAWANNKLGGDLEKIQNSGKYFIEVWRASGMDLSKVEFKWVSEEVKDENYWRTVMQVARNSTVKRILRCSQIMGRSENESLSASQILYPCMQAADIFYLKADIAQLGMDQRKVNVLAREIGPSLGFWKPVIVSHHMLMGLVQPKTQSKDAVERAIEMKMSKSIPDSAIFMNDSEEEVKRKIAKAYCPAKIIEENPMMEYMKYIIFEKFDSIKISRPDKFGGNLEIGSFSELSKLYGEGAIHPADLKTAVACYINELLEPVRAHFRKNSKAAKLAELVRSYEVTR